MDVRQIGNIRVPSFVVLDHGEAIVLGPEGMHAGFLSRRLADAAVRVVLSQAQPEDPGYFFEEEL